MLKKLNANTDHIIGRQNIQREADQRQQQCCVAVCPVVLGLRVSSHRRGRAFAARNENLTQLVAAHMVLWREVQAVLRGRSAAAQHSAGREEFAVLARKGTGQAPTEGPDERNIWDLFRVSQKAKNRLWEQATRSGQWRGSPSRSVRRVLVLFLTAQPTGIYDCHLLGRVQPCCCSSLCCASFAAGQVGPHHKELLMDKSLQTHLTTVHCTLSVSRVGLVMAFGSSLQKILTRGALLLLVFLACPLASTSHLLRTSMRFF